MVAYATAVDITYACTSPSSLRLPLQFWWQGKRKNHHQCVARRVRRIAATRCYILDGSTRLSLHTHYKAAAHVFVCFVLAKTWPSRVCVCVAVVGSIESCVPEAVFGIHSIYTCGSRWMLLLVCAWTDFRCYVSFWIGPRTEWNDFCAVHVHQRQKNLNERTKNCHRLFTRIYLVFFFLSFLLLSTFCAQ